MRYTAADFLSNYSNNVASGLTLVKSATDSKWNFLRDTKLGRLQTASLDTSIRLLRHYPKLGWNYPDIKVKNTYCPVEETIEVEKPFCNLMKFRRKGLPKSAPKVLFIAALSGHHATLSRETFEEFLPDHEVYVTDWLDARQVPISEGRFGFEEYTGYIIEFLQAIGPGTHIIGLCQAGVPGLVAASVLSAAGDAAKPKSMAFMASPIDIRVNPGLLSKVAAKLNLQAISLTAIHKVPKRYPGVGRMVYPGMLQLGNFMSLSIRSHIESHARYFRAIYDGDFEAADKLRDFYDEYFSVLDSTAEFYTETLERVFMDQHLPKGIMKHCGKTVDCGAIKDIPLLTVEGMKDNMVMSGQCHAAHDMCKNLPKSKKETLDQEGVGHYGVFSGSKFRAGIAPRLKEFIAKYN